MRHVGATHYSDNCFVCTGENYFCENLCLHNRILLPQHGTKNQIKLNLNNFCGNKINNYYILQRQRLSQKFSSTHEVKTRLLKVAKFYRRWHGGGHNLAPHPSPPHINVFPFLQLCGAMSSLAYYVSNLEVLLSFCKAIQTSLNFCNFVELYLHLLNMYQI